MAKSPACFGSVYKVQRVLYLIVSGSRRVQLPVELGHVRVGTTKA